MKVKTFFSLFFLLAFSLTTTAQTTAQLTLDFIERVGNSSNSVHNKNFNMLVDADVWNNTPKLEAMFADEFDNFLNETLERFPSVVYTEYPGIGSHVYNDVPCKIYVQRQGTEYKITCWFRVVIDDSDFNRE